MRLDLYIQIKGSMAALFSSHDMEAPLPCVAYSYGLADIPVWLFYGVLALLILLPAVLAVVLIRMCCKLNTIQRELNKNSNTLRALDENLPEVAMFQFQRDLGKGTCSFLYISDSLKRMLGIDRKQLLQDPRTGLDYIYEEDLPILDKAFRSDTEQQQPANLEIRVLDATGGHKWLYISALPVKEEQQLTWYGFAQDVSLMKEAESLMAEESKNFEHLFDTIDDFLMICDENGRFLDTNPPIKKRLGYPEDALKEMSLFQLLRDEDQQQAFEVVAQLKTQNSATCSLPLLMQSGAIIPVQMNLFKGSWERQPAIFCVARDVAHYQQTESALRESQRMLQLIIDTIPMSIFWKDQDSVYLGSNRAFMHECQLSTVHEVVGKTPYDLFDSVLAPDIVERDQSVMKTNNALMNYSESHTRPDGSLGWREISLIPLHDEDNNAVGVLGVWRDVTEQNRAEERLKRTLDDMERFNQLMRGRERRTLELKAEINDLLTELGKPKKYRTTTEDLI